MISAARAFFDPRFEAIANGCNNNLGATQSLSQSLSGVKAKSMGSVIGKIKAAFEGKTWAFGICETGEAGVFPAG